MTRLDTVQVCADLDPLPEPALMGTLRRQASRSGDVLSFEYEPSWLERDTFAFDPDLTWVAGPQYPVAERANFGIFLDSAPDRWGRVLMQRRENLRSRQEGRRPRALTEWDFLLGVHDETRLGALRFRPAPDQPFLESDDALAAPPLTSLRELQAASLWYELHAEEEDHSDYERWLAQLFAPGTSLGGARPKASMRDETGWLCMAKFPSRRDTRDVGAWELVAHRLAEGAGIVVPGARPWRVGESPHTTFLVRRFDRTPTHGRVAFVSAMTLTQREDGEEGASYLELVDLLQTQGVATEIDCEQLFRRVVFNILIHNTDDHLRNHGFFLGREGIRLSPAYDLNPSIERRELSLAIDEVETSCEVSVAMEACESYGVTRGRAAEVLKEVRAAVGEWRRHARTLGIPRSEQELMAPAFPD
jgi:serine/threonine-protein kinase HipA